MLTLVSMNDKTNNELMNSTSQKELANIVLSKNCSAIYDIDFEKSIFKVFRFYYVWCTVFEC